MQPYQSAGIGPSGAHWGCTAAHQRPVRYCANPIRRVNFAKPHYNAWCMSVVGVPWLGHVGEHACKPAEQGLYPMEGSWRVLPWNDLLPRYCSS
jgi:hypothetical protein